MHHLMLDIETLGTKPGCVITQIACIPFTEDGPGPESTWFRANIDITTYGHNFHIDAATLKWAIEKGVPILRDNQIDAALALLDLANFIARRVKDDNRVKIWANSPTFDCEILEAAWRRFDIQVPWHYWHCLDYRTEMWRDPRRAEPAAHDATQDCLDQIARLVAKWKADAATRALAYSPNISDPSDKSDMSDAFDTCTP